MTDLNKPYSTKQTGDTPLPMPPDIYGVNRTRFSTWDRLNLERLAEELVAELNETKEELRVALKAYRKSVKDCDK